MNLLNRYSIFCIRNMYVFRTIRMTYVCEIPCTDIISRLLSAKLLKNIVSKYGIVAAKRNLCARNCLPFAYKEKYLQEKFKHCCKFIVTYVYRYIAKFVLDSQSF